jgi:hypothetical protein
MEKNLSLATFTITNLTWNALVLKNSVCDDKQLKNCLMNGTDL